MSVQCGHDFENVRNFLVSVQEIGLPTFEASDLEQGGKSARIVNCVLGLKSYSDWKQTGGNGVYKFGGTLKLTTPIKHHVRKNSEPFTNSLSRNLSMNEKSLGALCPDNESSKIPSLPLSMLVRTILLDKKVEEVPTLVESVLTKVMEEFERRVASQVELESPWSPPLLGSSSVWTVYTTGPQRKDSWRLQEAIDFTAVSFSIVLSVLLDLSIIKQVLN